MTVADSLLQPVNLAVLGAGPIGKRHIEHVLSQPDANLMAIVEALSCLDGARLAM